MRVIQIPKQMQILAECIRNKGEKIGFVPTMGFFHEGHLSLMRKAKEISDVTVVSIFVNPTQFGPGEDLITYPRDFGRDCDMAKEEHVDIIFAPDVEDIYPQGYQTYVQVIEVTKNLCGFSRPHHFKGVTTIVSKLFNIVKPHYALFGMKDFQQFVTIKRMVADLNFDVEIIGVPTVRENDELAMSSRNVSLLPEQRRSALSLSRSIKEAQELFLKGERKVKNIIDHVSDIIIGEEHNNIDYVKICDVDTLEDIQVITHKALLAIAVRIGETRLIDNTILGDE